MSTDPQRYAVYLAAATDSEPAGTVVNSIMWDGVSEWSPPTGQAVVADPTGAYPIGSVYAQPGK